jgi:hypothetical protein
MLNYQPVSRTRDATNEAVSSPETMRTGKKAHDLGVISVMLRRLNNERLPRVLAIKQKVDNGKRLEDWDIAYLEQSFADARQAAPLLERNPEYHDFAARLLHLYKEITDRALENERK